MNEYDENVVIGHSDGVPQNAELMFAPQEGDFDDYGNPTGGPIGGGGDNNDVGGGGDSVHVEHLQDMMQLRALCDAAREEDEESWEAVRAWLRGHNADEALEAAERTGEYRTTSLHLACSNRPPMDVVAVLLSAAMHTVQWVDDFGWLPLHYACAKGASEGVLQMLVEAFADGTKSTDNRGRTPLHFALANTERPATPSIVQMLSSSGAAMTPDKNGMLPIHYAGAYGASEEALEVLTHDYPETLNIRDNKGRQTLHFALGNADRPASLAVVRFLLRRNRDVVNSTDFDQQLPLHFLATRSVGLPVEQKQGRENAEKCLELYLNAEPLPTADFLTTLQSLPEWLSDRAVVSPVVQELLNHKIAQRFPTAIILMDFYFLVAVVITHWFTVQESLRRRTASRNEGGDDESLYDDDDNDNSTRALEFEKLVPLYVAAAYFTLREIVQMASLWGLGLFQNWLHDPTNWLDVTFIVLTVVWAVLMQTGAGDDDVFRTGAALTLIVLYLNSLSFLKSLFIDFAVFVGGLFYVVQRLAAFLSVLVIILIAFAQMFYTVFRQTGICAVEENANRGNVAVGVDEDDLGDFQVQQALHDLQDNLQDLSRGMGNAAAANQTIAAMNATVSEILNSAERPFCDLWTSFLKVFTMLLGEVDETYFDHSRFARCLFVLFMFLVVILLANLLIAIVTDSYGVIKNERAAIVFWSNRLDFVAEMDAIWSGPWQRKIGAICCCNSLCGKTLDPTGAGAAAGGGEVTTSSLISANASDRTSSLSLRYGEGGRKDTFFDFWKRLVDLFDEDLQGVGPCESLCYLGLRALTALVIIPSWLLLGLLSAGLLWPPQVREIVFIQRVQKGRNPQDMLKEPEQRQMQIKAVREDVREFQEDVVTELLTDRREVQAMKRQIARLKLDVQSEMKEIKDIVLMLYDVQSAGER